jgi:hypothetical protein
MTPYFMTFATIPFLNLIDRKQSFWYFKIILWNHHYEKQGFVVDLWA